MPGVLGIARDPERRRGRGDDVRPGPSAHATRCASRGTPGPNAGALRRADPRRSSPRPPRRSSRRRSAASSIDARRSTSRSRRTRRSRCTRASPTSERDRAEIWYGAKSPIVASQEVAAAVGLPADRVTLHVVRAGGSFGHRLFFEPAIEAAQVSKALGRPIKLMWTRNDDMRHGRMRPASHHKVRATLPARQRAHLRAPPRDVARRLLPRSRRGALGAAGFSVLSPGVTQTVFALSQNVPYDFGVGDADAHRRAARVPDRIVALDLLGPDLDRERDHGRRDRAGARTPIRVAFRRKKLTSARTRAVLDQVASAGQWGRSMPAGHGAGRRDPRGVQVGGRVSRRDRLPRSHGAARHEGRVRGRRRSRDQSARSRGAGAGRARPTGCR